MKMLEKENLNITEDEAALYDRQIRLWGLDAQKRLRTARVLLVGVSGLGAEVAKNIVLSGIKSILLLDPAQVTEEDFANQFLVNRDDVGKNRAECSLARTQQLNPMVEVKAESSCVTDKPDDFFLDFDVVCVTNCSQEQLLRINEICHKNNIMFYAGDVFGYYGYMFADLNHHEYAEDVQKPVKKSDPSEDGEPAAKKSKIQHTETVTIKSKTDFCRLKDALGVDWGSDEMKKKIKKTPDTFFIMRVLMEFHSKHGRDPEVKTAANDREDLKSLKQEVLDKLKVNSDVIDQDFQQYCFAELSPVCAVTGGILGQEIIKAVSKKDPPHNNFFFYNGVNGNGMVDKIG